MNRYNNLFKALERENQGAFVPFVTLGDPSLHLSKEIIQTLIDSGADALELGMPFSDPLADGPVIQNANLRALTQHITPNDCFEVIRSIRETNPLLPIGLLMYANLIYAMGINDFYAQCAHSGIDSVLIADVPIEEASEFIRAAKDHQICPVFIAPPNANEQTLELIASLSQGYTYLVSRAGVTGIDRKSSQPLNHIVNTLNKYHAPPALLGFGISTPEQVKSSLTESRVNGVISGSAIVQLIETYHRTPTEMMKKLSKLIRTMKAATHLNQ